MGHGTNLISLLSLMNNFDRDCLINNFKINKDLDKECLMIPGDSSSINIELYAPLEGSGDFRIKVKLNDDYLSLEKPGSSKIIINETDKFYSF